MAITITGEQIYKGGTARTTPQVQSGIKFCEAGYASNSSSNRYVTLYTCETDKPLSQITFSIKTAGTAATNASKFLGVYVTTTKNDTYLTSSTGGDTKLEFGSTCVDDGTLATGTSGVATGTVTKSIPKGTFYIYVVPYSASSNTTYSTFYSKDSTTSPVTVTGVEVQGYVYIDNGTGWDAYQCYIDNGTSWDLYIPYIDNGTSWDMY